MRPDGEQAAFSTDVLDQFLPGLFAVLIARERADACRSLHRFVRKGATSHVYPPVSHIDQARRAQRDYIDTHRISGGQRSGSPPADTVYYSTICGESYQTQYPSLSTIFSARL